MDKVETVFMNSPVRRAMQRRLALPLMGRCGGPLPGGSRVLEIGCGSGYGSRLLLEEWGAGHVDAVDLDPAMVRRARRRLVPHSGRVRVGVADVTDLGALVPADGEYDAVVNFGILHHVLDWQAAVREVARVLKPGGTFYFEELTKQGLQRPHLRHNRAHPTENRFTGPEFVDELEAQGLTVLGRRDPFFGDMIYGGSRRDG
ncbi:class I SAM-dependent methyltransferase [Actinomadura sp. GTD37]|uniref:class I SAM-dependent methyltransferase n=1 Tax=Actinomadura sp. GTD37 TaxID=1778030 RepID=UPI0035C18889